MKARWIAFAALLMDSAHLAMAHRLDEYLQATFISVERQQIRGDLFLTPGQAVVATMLAQIDRDQNGELSEFEQRSYAQQVLQNQVMTLNGLPLAAELVAFEFSTVEQLREGRGDIHLEFTVKLPATPDSYWKFRFENQHQSDIAAYQINCLAPRDPTIRIGAQRRDESQSVYELDVTRVK